MAIDPTGSVTIATSDAPPGVIVPTSSSPSPGVVVAKAARPVGLPPKELNEDERLAWHLCQSGYFTEARQLSQAVVKIHWGKAMGIDPVAAMTGIYITQQGRPALTANLMARVIKASGKYRWKILEHTARVCRLEVFERVPTSPSSWEWESLGEVATTREEFSHLSTAVWKQYPKNMLFARCISNVAKWHAAEAFGGITPYLPDEIPGSGLIVNGETLEVEFSEPPQKSSPASARPTGTPIPTEVMPLLQECEKRGLDVMDVLRRGGFEGADLLQLTEANVKRLITLAKVMKPWEEVKQ